MDKKQLEQRFAEWQKENHLPERNYPKQFREWVLKAIIFHSPASIKMTAFDYVSIAKKKAAEYTMWDLGAILHMLEIRTAAEMNMKLEEYCDFQLQVEGLIKLWQKTVAPVGARLQKEFEAKAKLEQKNANREIPLTPLNKVDSPPVGEA